MSEKRDFILLWIGQTVSLMGDEFMKLALPLLAVLVLGTTPAMAALLSFALFVPFLIIGLQAGAIVERHSRRMVMLWCNLAQFVLIAVIWILTTADLISFPLLAGLVLLSGCALVFFQVAYTSYLPALFSDPDDLHQANSRLALSESTSMSAGPMIAGPVIQLVGIVAVTGLNALSFLFSVVTLASIRHPGPARNVRAREKGWMRRDIGEGLRLVVHHPSLQPILACGTIYVMFLSMVETSLVLYCLRVLELKPAMIGVVTGAAAAGYPIGNLLSTHARRHLGTYRGMLIAASVSVTGVVLMPAMGSIGGTVGVIGLIVGSIVHSIGEGVFSPISLTVRQTESPPEMLSRISSVQRFLMWGAVALGSLLAAGSTAMFGLSGTVWIGAVGSVLSVPALYRRAFRDAVRPPIAGPRRALDASVGAHRDRQGLPAYGIPRAARPATAQARLFVFLYAVRRPVARRALDESGGAHRDRPRLAAYGIPRAVRSATAHARLFVFLCRHLAASDELGRRPLSDPTPAAVFELSAPPVGDAEMEQS